MLTWQTMPGIARLLILTWLCLGFVSASGYVPSHSDGWCGHVGVPSHDPMESRQGSDYTSITIDDASSLLDCSGCHMLMLGSMSEG